MGEQQEGPQGTEPNRCCVMVERLQVGMLLEKRRLGIRLARWRLSERQNHNRNFMRAPLPSTQNDHTDHQETEENEPYEDVVTMFLNHSIQKLRNKADIEHRVFHTFNQG
jgi:hypothetical protein